MNASELETAEEFSESVRETGANKYVPLAVWMLVVLTLFLIAMKVVSYGYLPGGDARRHVAKAFTDKPYKDIVVMRPEYTIDHSPGWEWLLRQIEKTTGWNIDALASFSVIFFLLCIFAAPLIWLRRPEAWLAALLAQMVAIPELMIRLVQARPYLLTEAVLIAILFSWSKPQEKNPPKPKLVFTSIAIGLTVWIHGTWYLWALPVVAFFMARQWRHAFWLAVCCVVGTLGGALLTGHPFEFLQQAFLIAKVISQEHVPQWMLVGEFLPSYGEFATLTLMAVVVLFYRQQKHDAAGLFRSPVLWLILICWILGFKADRFWADWGVPAVLVLLTLLIQEILARFTTALSPKRLIVCGLLAAPLFLHSTNDLDRRYTRSLSEVFLDAKDPKLEGWLPERNGIFYSARMDLFYNTFYKNPTADWRYIMGFEPALMPDDDLKIFRDIQRSGGVAEAYIPWINRMQPGDRLAILSSTPPALPQLQWLNAAGNIWIGKLPLRK